MGRWEMLKPEVEALVLWAGSVRYCTVLRAGEPWGVGGVCVTVVRGTEVGSVSHHIRRRATVQQKVFPEQGSPGEPLTSGP